MINKYALISLCLILFSNPLFASDGLNNSKDISSEPIEISADGSFEWLRAEKKYLAIGNAVVKQGKLSLKSDTLNALYDDEENRTEIKRVIAEKNVIISSPPHNIYGDKAVYNIETGIVTITGNNLKLATDSETITAKDKFEYNVNTRVMIANTNVVVKHEDDILKSDRLIAYFIDKNGKMVLNKVEAKKNVSLKTPKEKITGNFGHYNAISKIATINGNVKISQGKNQLLGNKAVVNLKSGISKIFGSEKKRVSGTFFPKSGSKSSSAIFSKIPDNKNIEQVKSEEKSNIEKEINKDIEWSDSLIEEVKGQDDN